MSFWKNLGEIAVKAGEGALKEGKQAFERSQQQKKEGKAPTEEKEVLQMLEDDKFSSAYSDDSFWEKAKTYAKVAGKGVMEPALKMYYATLDSGTPVWAKGVIIGALGYFISPVDAVPDILPVVGYTDDLGVLAAAVGAVAAHIKDEHVSKAKETLARWFPEH